MLRLQLPSYIEFDYRITRSERLRSTVTGAERYWLEGNSCSVRHSTASYATVNNNTIGGTWGRSITDNVVGSYAMYAIPDWRRKHERDREY